MSDNTFPVWTPLPHGPRWQVTEGEPSTGRAGPWLAADRLADPAGDELSRLLESERAGSGHRTGHATALTLMAVYAGRVTAAAVLHWALYDEVPDMRSGNVLLRPAAHGIGGVQVRRSRLLVPRAGEDPVRLLHRTVLDGHLLPIADALHRRTRAGLRQLRGGIAHGCATALCAYGAQVDLLAARWRQFADTAPGGLAALGEVARVRRSPDGPERLVYLRNTCCLYYTSAEAVRCASCCLTSREERLRAYATPKER
ncbi:(2Fe-2S)-binding protein [Streptomyces sp. NBC_01387]|uniref:(2Fe-2S)-binding protein n=1 Tax=unclassified Streptomyces TaxID=2593676 RepID=UPI00224E2D36|nr:MULTISPECIES: (2Fe-2S)-binding protein [unclassified Streptomyces]MCX4552988.1 (2Fe-2S)-binding protein [Streptomyces sp. NBC_01500]WSC24309.1 (2Fe-2S)-binding protein [Streptomyces sp. NBC_01766]